MGGVGGVGADEGVEAPAVGGLGGEEQAGRAHAEYGVIDGGCDAAGDGHGHGEAEGEDAAGVGCPAGEQTCDQEEAAGDLDDGGDYGEDLREGKRQEVHYLVGVCGEMMPVPPGDPRASIRSPGAEAVEAE